MPISHMMRRWNEEIGSRSRHAPELGVTFSLTSPAPVASGYRELKLLRPGGSSDRRSSAGRTERTACTVGGRGGRDEECGRPEHPHSWYDDPQGILAR